MDLKLGLVMGALFALCWWAGFAATKRMRLEKNREREQRMRPAPGPEAGGGRPGDSKED